MKYMRIAEIMCSAVLVSSCGLSRYAVNTEYPAVEGQDSCNGILEECFYECSDDGPSRRRMYVYLPHDYHESDRHYPVLYLLHGARGNETSWIMKGDLLHKIDSLTKAAAMDTTIIVLPNVNQYDDDQDYGRSRLKGALESFFETDGMVEAAFVTDVVMTIDSLYRTIPDKQHRAIAGLSIGAMQSMYISANNPEIFNYIGMFSPMVHPVLRRSDNSSFYKHLKTKQEKQFASPPELYSIMIGKSDFYYPRMVAYSRYLESKGYPFEMDVSNGGHDWYNWKAYVGKFMQKLWNEDTSSYEEDIK